MKNIARLLGLSLLILTSHALAEPVQLGSRSYLALPVHFTNSCASSENNSTPASACKDPKSDAQSACAQVGGHLPTLQEFTDLLHDLGATESGLVVERGFFQSGTIPSLTDRGVKKFEMLFGLADANETFWTSSSHVSMPDEQPMTNAWVFYIYAPKGEHSGAFTASRTFTAHAVICVAN